MNIEKTVKNMKKIKKQFFEFVKYDIYIYIPFQVQDEYILYYALNIPSIVYSIGR